MEARPGGSSVSLWASGIAYTQDVDFNSSGTHFVAGGYNPMTMHSLSAAGSGTLFASVSAFSAFVAIEFDSGNNAFVAGANNTIHRISSAGIVSTFLIGYSATAIAIDTSDNVYLAAANTLYMMA